MIPAERTGCESGAGRLGRKLANGFAVLHEKGACGLLQPAEDYLETPLDLTKYLIENKAATFKMRVGGDSMKDAGILDGDLLVVDRAARPVNVSVVVVAVMASTRSSGCAADRIACGSIRRPSLSAAPCVSRGRAACRRCRKARDSHDAMRHGRGLRAHRLQQLLRLLRTGLPPRSRRGSRHRSLEQRWLRCRKVIRLCGICAFVKLGRPCNWNLLDSSQVTRTVFVRINLYAQIDKGFCVRRLWSSLLMAEGREFTPR